MQSQPAPVRNRLLASLPAEALAAVMPKLRQVPLVMRQLLYHQGGPIEATYFPEQGMVSMVTNLEEGMQAEVGLIGPEGMLGVALLSGAETSFVESMVQMPGSGWRMAAADFRREVEANTAFRMALLRYSEAMQAQVMQTAACNGRHDLEQRLARWLLMAHDRAGGDDLPLTQEFMAMMLGVHRPSITVTAGILQRAGLIRHVSGKVTVLDRPSLEAAACGCYAAVAERFAALLGTAKG